MLQHIECEPPGEFEDVLLDRGATIHRVELDEGDALPDWRDFDAIVAMGGPMSVNDEHVLPWLDPEKALIRDAVESGVPFWGSCLGVQLLASSLGAEVYARAGARGRRARRAADRRGPHRPGVQRPARTMFPTLQWHGDTFDLPAGAVRLASSPAYPNQAIRYGRSAYGVQFHLEVSGAMARGVGHHPCLHGVGRERARRQRHRDAAERVQRQPRAHAGARPDGVRELG